MLQRSGGRGSGTRKMCARAIQEKLLMKTKATMRHRVEFSGRGSGHEVGGRVI